MTGNQSRKNAPPGIPSIDGSIFKIWRERSREKTKAELCINIMKVDIKDSAKDNCLLFPAPVRPSSGMTEISQLRSRSTKRANKGHINCPVRPLS